MLYVIVDIIPTESRMEIYLYFMLYNKTPHRIHSACHRHTTKFSAENSFTANTAYFPEVFTHQLTTLISAKLGLRIHNQKANPINQFAMFAPQHSNVPSGAKIATFLISST